MTGLYDRLQVLEGDRKLGPEERMKALEKPLLAWYRANARILPWREDPAPYRVWISEIMLQQTRVEAVKPYFERFMRELPTVRDLAAAEDDRLMKLWEGLGYYSRARNLKKAAVIACESYGGELPADYGKLQKLPESEATRRGPSLPSPSGSRSLRWTEMCCGWFPGFWPAGRTSPARR